MKIALAQINATIGDFQGNREKILSAYRQGIEMGVDMVVLPELAICGYPPRDLLLQASFLQQNQELLHQLAKATDKTGLLVGYAGSSDSTQGRPATNSVALCQNGSILATRNKSLLPSYDVFDEDRYFQPAQENLPVEFNGQKIGLTICEDVWNDEDFWPARRYDKNPAMDLVKAGAEMIFNVSASPWQLGKGPIRHQMLATMAAKIKRPLLYANLIGGNDELVFDGTSLALNASGQLLGQGKRFEEDLIVVDTESAPLPETDPVPDMEQVFNALSLGVRDYLFKCGFKSAVLGLSGGIDSAVTAAIAAHALGSENVRGVAMPSRYSSKSSLDDAEALVGNLGIQYHIIPIDPVHSAMLAQLKEVFAGLKEDTTEENIQARLRGAILMSLSNKFGSLLLTTGNKSELAVGYCTLYGDMCGGLAVISDVPKTMVYGLAEWINREKDVIPPNTITKPPSAELRPDQTDQDSLPPYDLLDAILEAYVVEGQSADDMIASGQDPDTVRKIVRLIEINEYKRRQAAPGLKVTSKAFGVGRRIPIARKF